VWVPRGGHRWRAIEAMVAAAAALASFPQLYIYSAADAVVRDASIESHVRVPPRLAAAVRPSAAARSPAAPAPTPAGAASGCQTCFSCREASAPASRWAAAGAVQRQS
jgi:hypothetical protein